jgi:hypothetical protein
MKNPNMFFTNLPPDRLFKSTAGIVPKDRRLTPQGSWAELRKPPTRREPDGAFIGQAPHQNRLEKAFKRFQERQDSAKPPTTAPGSSSLSQTMHSPLSFASPAKPDPMTLSADTQQEKSNDESTLRFDGLQQAWFRHPAKSKQVTWPTWHAPFMPLFNSVLTTIRMWMKL